jgi:HEAT repeat protein
MALDRRVRLRALWIFGVIAWGHSAPAEVASVAPNRPYDRYVGELKAGATYRLLVSLRSGTLGPRDRFEVVLEGPGGDRLGKSLHAGDPDLALCYRPSRDGPATLRVAAQEGAEGIPVLVEWAELPLSAEDVPAIEAEPNDDWRRANPLRLGRDVYGSADDVDYLENLDEGRAGLDWFRLDYEGDGPRLVYFQLDLVDRDVSANLRLYTIDDEGRPVPYVEGKDPNEVVHDRERERYSKHISRVLRKGTYYLEVNANHPSYVLRTRALPVPPYDAPGQAVEAGAHYLMNVGDAWFAQVPREGNIHLRTGNLHETATRCTACHAAIFPTEATLAAHRAGYPIRSKDDFQYVIDRLYNSITPLYGTEDLGWQRYIAIPLQSQGKGGGVLLEFEREVSGIESPTFRRFAPFLREAWRGRAEMPADEVNGVVPLDSKFGLAWRDWRVLRESFRRASDPRDLEAADAIERLVSDPASSAKVETLQDRIHRLYARHVMGSDSEPSALRRDAEALLALQNEDGGWHEVDSSKGPSAVYTTGQLVWTLLEVGYTKDDPRIERALRYLLAQQQPFGGWFQTTTHENFRTPMRETRYAVMALARAYPKGEPLASWGNRDEGPARVPRLLGSLVPTLDDLESLWDAPEGERLGLVRAITPLLDHREPLIRAHAASALGRLGREEAVGPLVATLDDPSKVVWRAAAASLRRLGNAGIGVDAIAEALQARDPLIRRGAARVFAYQFYGMDERTDLALRLLQRMDDPDLWTRLQALRSLRQWFYRTRDASLQRRIVYAYLGRMAEEEVPSIRKGLIENMYIMLDENLGGGVSIQKNLRQLPDATAARVLAARREFERSVLLTPLFGALQSGGDRQREAVLRSFDGSFFQGRSYARRPTNMIDVGNDREFEFLDEPPTDVLDRTFAAVFEGEGMGPEARRRAIELARFFAVPERTASPAVRTALLRALTDDDPDVRRAAGDAVASLSLRGLADDPETIARLTRLLREADEAVGSISRALAGEPESLESPSLLDALHARLGEVDAALRLGPLLARPEFRDDEVAAAVRRGWDHADRPADRVGLLELLAARPSLVDLAEPSEPVREVLRAAVHDPSAQVRERLLAIVAAMPRLRGGVASAGLILAALADDTPSIRRIGLELAATRPDFWRRPDAREALLRLLVDPDAATRDRTLGVVESGGLIADSPKVARRVKAVAADPALAERANAALRAGGFDPTSVSADVALGRRRLPSLATFRERINPVFYQKGEDGYSCARCHATHSILRLAEAPSAEGMSDEQIAINFGSVLKVVNPGEPESSLVLRKPRSPQGQGDADPQSPTGLTHVGGPRWADTDDPAYRALLDWLRDAQGSEDAGVEPKASADGYAPGHAPVLALDDDPSTYWSTETDGGRPGFPHELTVDLGSVREVSALLYQPRQEPGEGRVRAFEVWHSRDGRAWSGPSGQGTWEDDPSFKVVTLPGVHARFVRLRGLSEQGGGPVMTAAEVVVESRPVEGSHEGEDAPP